jgi:hypothetical protein
MQLATGHTYPQCGFGKAGCDLYMVAPTFTIGQPVTRWVARTLGGINSCPVLGVDPIPGLPISQGKWVDVLYHYVYSPKAKTDPGTG